MTDLIVGDAASDASPKSARSKTRPFATLRSGRDDRRLASPDNGAEDNRLAPYAPAILAVRWATTGVSIVLASPELLALDPIIVGWVSVILANTVFRTIRPLRYNGSQRSEAVMVSEIALHVLAVVTTGYWDSSLVLLMINAVIVAGFARGFGFAIRVGIISTVLVTAFGIRSENWDVDHAAQAAQWTTLLLSGGLIAGYTRRISGEANRRHNLALDRVARLADANSLLADLHRVAQTLPASLDLGDVLESTLSRLRGLLNHDVAMILTREESDDTWSIATQRGLGLTGDLEREQMPGPMRRAIRQGKLVRVLVPPASPSSAAQPSDAHASGVQGLDAPDADKTLSALSAAAMYVPLLARGQLIGLLGVESRSADSFSDRDEQILRGFVEPVALAIDNARWFDRIRTVAADEERTRIARDLHDRIGQSLAYLGVEMDRMIRRDEGDEPNGENLRRLRSDLREVIGEVRDTLSDLRTDVSDVKDFAQTANEFATRLSHRCDLEISIDCDTSARLPILQEREMWRIAQEALVNVERHAEASTASVLLRLTPTGTLLEVVDDGRGLPRSTNGRVGRMDSYGIIGMRERAASVGATFELLSEPGEGTTVRCFLPQT